MSFIYRLWGLIFSGRRSECEIRLERQFIEAVNSLKTLSVTDRGGMSIDPEEMLDLITELRENYSTWLIQLFASLLLGSLRAD